MLKEDASATTGVRGIRLPLLVKMLVLLLPTVVVPLIIVGAISIHRGTDAVERTAELGLQLSASSAGERLDQVFEQAQRLQGIVASTDTIIQACTAAPDRRKDLLDAAERWLKEVVARDDDLALAYLADDRGVCTVSTSPNMVGIDYKATRDYMRSALDGKSVISDLAIGVTTREPGVFLAGPVKGPGGKLAGVVVLKLKGKVIDRVCQDVSGQTTGGFALVVDANHVIISHPNPIRLYHSIGALPPETLKKIDPKLQYGVERIKSFGDDNLERAMAQGQPRGNLVFTGASGQPQVAGYARMNQRPWTVAVVQPRAQFDQPITELAAAQKWWIGGMGLVAVFGAFWITARLLGPIRSLRAAAMKAADGDWTARSTVISHDELGDLARTFNAMMPALQERAHMMDDLRLAKEVQERTQEQADELRAQQESLLAAEERTRLILDSSSEGILGVDNEGRIEFVNPSACKMLGFAAEELIGQPSHAIIHHHHPDGSEYPKEECPMYAAYKRGQASRIDDEFLWRKDGVGFPVEYGATPIVKDSAIVGAVISFTDITLRKRQEAELKRTNFLADSALDLTKSGYWHVPLDGSGWYNSSERAARIFGDHPTADYRYTIEHWLEHVRLGDEAAAKVTAEDFDAAVKGRIPVYDSTYAYKRPVDGRVVWIHALGHVVKDASGKPTDMYGVTQDITDFKMLEEGLRQAMRKAEEATVAKSAFLANMSHEIRTPMNGIMGMTELALDTELTSEQRDYLNTVKSSAEALLALLNDILDFSKIEAGKIELDPIEFHLRDAIADTLNPLALRASSKGLELTYEVGGDVPDTLIGDVYRVRQVIVNLVGNAIKFTSEGEVVVGIRMIERTGDDLTLEMAVRDTGIGIPADKVGKLFRPFEQADASTTRKYGGTGLGLAISRQLVELMGGQLALDSEVGVGSTFHFTIKLRVGTQRPAVRVEEATRLLAEKTALIVDDNETNRRILVAITGHWGLRTIQADSGMQALAALDRAHSAGRPVSLVITDLHMPEMDGFTLVERVRASAQHRDVPVVLLSSSATTGDQDRCNQLRIVARLLKPVKQSLLLDNIMRAVIGTSQAGLGQNVPPVPEPQQGGRAVPLRVLLAEDNPVNQKFAIRLLEGAGHKVTVAGDGLKALEAWGAGELDLILMDVQMPNMDGLEATREIRRKEAQTGRRIPVIAMTANAMKGDREMCMDAGMDGYVAKPVKKEALFAEIDRVINKKEDANGQNIP